MTAIEMILEMTKLQEALDKKLFEKGRKLGKITWYDRDRVILALIDEIGELVHELKGDWCWWKASQKPVDRNKVLEELVDVWHFGLSLDIQASYNLCNKKLLNHIDWWQPSRDQEEVLDAFYYLIDDAYNRCFVTESLYRLSYALGFTIEDVYQGYIKKNKENYERIESGY